MGACCSKPAAADVDADDKANDATGGLSEVYEVKHLLGSGSAGDTWLCRDRALGELLAVKLMKRPIPPLMGTNIMREVKIGAQLGKGHLNIVKPKEVILTRTHLGLVMEYVAGGNMADYILKTILLKFGSFDTRDGLVMEEDEARYFFTQIINAVEYCHNNKVAHRDLKMDNTLLDDNDPPRIKLCDFGFAKWWTQEPQMSTITGTPDYMSPQLLGPKASNKQALYDGTKADIWAAGVMLCVMLIGRFPFEGIEMSSATNLEDVSAHVWRQQNSQRWHDNPLIAQDCFMLSSDSIDLLNKMFDLDEHKRITISGIRNHPWFCKPLPPLYQQALAAMNQEQASIDQQVREMRERQVAAGAFVNKDRDSALKRMIYLAASRYSPEQEDPVAGIPDGTLRISASMLRKISLTAIKPYEYEDANSHMDLATISNFFKQTMPAQQDGTSGSQEKAEQAVQRQADQHHQQHLGVQQQAPFSGVLQQQQQQKQQQQQQASTTHQLLPLPPKQQQQQQQRKPQQEDLPQHKQHQAGSAVQQHVDSNGSLHSSSHSAAEPAGAAWNTAHGSTEPINISEIELQSHAF